MLASLIATAFCLQGAAGVSDSIVATARQAAELLVDTGTARRHGFRPLGGKRFTDRTPFQGQHWISLRRGLTAGVELDHPVFVMYSPVGGSLQVVGVAYATRIRHDDPVPEGLGGYPVAWHLHQACFGIPGERFALADGVEDCRARGGTPTPRQVAMVHVWTGAPNPQGPYAHDNLALPYLAVGLSSPTPADLADPERARRGRLLALALAETYDARMPFARRIEMANRDRASADSLQAHRDAIARAVPLLQAAEAQHDRAAYEAVAGDAVAQWEALWALYQRLAPTPEFRRDLTSQYAVALGDAHQHLVHPGHHPQREP